MDSPSVVSRRSTPDRRWAFSDASGFGLVELRNRSPLIVQLLPSGAIFALRHGPTLINQVLPGPEEDGLFRLLLRWRNPDGQPGGWAPLVGGGLNFQSAGPSGAMWSCTPLPGLLARVQLELHPTLAAWSWRVQLHNESLAPLVIDVVHAQDLGLADEAAVRNNEAYTSHYLDLAPVRDAALGWVLLARQNQPMAHGRHPWLGLACAQGAAEYCTDGWQFFGADHRITGVPAAVRPLALPSRRSQYEAALAGLQTHPKSLAPGSAVEFAWVARYVEDHPAASSPADVDLLRAMLPMVSRPALFPPLPSSDVVTRSDRTVAGSQESNQGQRVQPRNSLWLSSPWIHGDVPTVGDWDAWFHGPRRQEEYGPDDALLAFFHGAATHVVARDKEATIARPHGHLLRSGDSRWFDAGHLGLTCYAAGVFAAQVYLGHPSFARLLSVVRNALNVTRASGQRVFIKRGQGWHQLGVPSAFAMSPGEVRWIYRLDEEVIEARVWCARDLAASFLELRVTAGPPAEFLVSHELVLGATEFEHPGLVDYHTAEGWVSAQTDRRTLVGQHQPDVGFAIAVADSSHVAALGGDGLFHPDGVERHGPYVALRTKAVTHCGILLLGTTQGPDSLPHRVTAARGIFAHGGAVALPPAAPFRLTAGSDAGIARIDEVLPWFAHNASIHFSAPHGLEQSGGAAWGVRDVCQGSVEWLLAAGEFKIVRRILETVFAQQYPHDGVWPQWFMFPPYQFIQQPHSHGDVCFWPVKALCDYLQASNDTALLHAPIGYTDPVTFAACGPTSSVLEHCDRVIAHCQARFFPGTALVNYGDGDWDDTLQPADPAMRTRMISAWTVALAYQTFRQLADVCQRIGDESRVQLLTDVVGRIRRDFSTHLMPGGVVAGFVFREPSGAMRPLLHPEDTLTKIRYRLLPMTRSILAGLFTAEEAKRHLAIMANDLLYPDGVRLMSEPATYRGGLEHWFKRADTAANVGREIGLQYVHAHLRYAEALARVGDAAGLWHALQVINPVGLAAVVPHAAPRQSNVYFSSSDADFGDRYEAAERWEDLRTGKVAVRGGWRLYSSGPGLFLHLVRASLLGVRETFDHIVFDPVLPPSLDGLIATVTLAEHPVELRFRVRHGGFTPKAIRVNGATLALDRTEANPYRTGGALIASSELNALLVAENNVIEIDL